MAAFAKTHASAGPSPTVPTGPQFDNRRMLAGIIDLMVPLAMGLAVGVAGLSLTRGMQVVVLGWALYYCFALESSGGQTLGKRAMKLRVVSADGSPATDVQIAKRTIVRIVDWNIIGLIVMLVSGERRQRLGDVVAGTVVTDAVATAPPATTEVPATTELGPSEAPVAAPPAVKEPKRRRGLKDLAKLEIGGSKKKQVAVEAPVVAAAAVSAPVAVKEPKRRRGLKDLAKLEIGGSKKKREAVQHAVVADQVEKQPRKRRSFKELGKIEIGRKKQAPEEPAAVMAAPAHAAEPLPPEALPESLRPGPGPEPAPVDPLDEPTVLPPLVEPEAVVAPERPLDHEPVVEVEPAPMPMDSPEPSVEIEGEPLAEHEPVVEIEIDPEPMVYEPVVEHEPQVSLEPEASPEQSLYNHAEPDPVAQPEPVVQVEHEPVVEIEIDPEPMVYEPVVEHEPQVSLEPEASPEQSLYNHAEPDPVAQPEPVVEIEREPTAYDAPAAREPEVVVEPKPMSEYLPAPSLYNHAGPDPVAQPEPVVEIEEQGGFAEPEPSPYAHLNAEPSPFGEESPYAPAEEFAEQLEPNLPQEPEPSLYQHAPEPELTRAPAPVQQASRYPETEAPDTPAPIVKPIETVSAMDLLMQDVEERPTGSDGSGA